MNIAAKAIVLEISIQHRRRIILAVLGLGWQGLQSHRVRPSPRDRLTISAMSFLRPGSSEDRHPAVRTARMHLERFKVNCKPVLTCLHRLVVATLSMVVAKSALGSAATQHPLRLNFDQVPFGVKHEHIVRSVQIAGRNKQRELPGSRPEANPGGEEGRWNTSRGAVYLTCWP